VLEFSCTHRLIPASDGLETSKEEGECSMPEKALKGETLYHLSVSVSRIW